MLIEEWVDTTSLSSVVANFARVHMLFSIFDGDPDKWIEFLNRYGTESERAHDLPFAEDIRRRSQADEMLLPRLKIMMRDFSTLIR